VPAKLYVGPRKTIDGKEVTMVIGFLPGNFTNTEKILTSEILFIETTEYPADKYYGWLVEDILRDGIQIGDTK
jgi:hypothetical protein